MNTIKGMDGISRDSDYPCISKRIDINSSIQKDPIPDKHGNNTDEAEDPRNFIIPFYKKYKIRIFKPLILLKLALFLWYGAGSPIVTFLIVFIKQKGMTFTELSTVFVMTPIGQFISSVICGIVADKIGWSKPVLIVNLLLNIVIAIGMIASPSLNLENCDPHPVKLKCHREEFDRLLAKTSCDVNTDAIELSSCSVTCPENVTQYCNGQNLICDILASNKNFDNFSLSVHVSWAYKRKSKCYYNVTSMSHEDVTYSWCNIPHKMYCAISCSMSADEGCSADNSGRSGILILNMVLLILFLSVISNTYIFFEVTAMTLVKEHNSHFGRQHFFTLAGIFVFSPIAGYIVGATKSDEGDINYDTAFYFFISMSSILLLVLCRLEVRIRPPSRNLWRKSFHLLKNPDFVFFIVFLIVVGTAWGFMKNYVPLYLEQIGASSFLLSFTYAINALYGLPILATSNWCMKKIETTQIFILGLLGYVASCIGYSFLYDPWFSLLIEATGIISFHLLWVAVMTHSHSIAPEGFSEAVISLAGGIHFSIGMGTGGMFGGLAMDAYGGRLAFRIMAWICLVTAVIYAIYLYVRKICCSVNATATMDAENEIENQVQNEL